MLLTMTFGFGSRGEREMVLFAKLEDMRAREAKLEVGRKHYTNK